jgi:hypothetical protein
MKNQKTNTLFNLIAGFFVLMMLFIFSACGATEDVSDTSDNSSSLDSGSSIVIQEPALEPEALEPVNEDDVEKVFESTAVNEGSDLAFSFTYMGSFVADDLGLWTKEGYENRINPPEGCEDCHIPFMKMEQVNSDLSLDEYIPGETELMQVGENLFTRYEDADTVTYYLKEGSTILSFKVFSLDNENDEFMNVIASLKFE